MPCLKHCAYGKTGFELRTTRLTNETVEHILFVSWVPPVYTFHSHTISSFFNVAPLYIQAFVPPWYKFLYAIIVKLALLAVKPLAELLSFIDFCFVFLFSIVFDRDGWFWDSGMDCPNDYVQFPGNVLHVDTAILLNHGVHSRNVRFALGGAWTPRPLRIHNLYAAECRELFPPVRHTLKTHDVHSIRLTHVPMDFSRSQTRGPEITNETPLLNGSRTLKNGWHLGLDLQLPTMSGKCCHLFSIFRKSVAVKCVSYFFLVASSVVIQKLVKNLLNHPRMFACLWCCVFT